MRYNLVAFKCLSVKGAVLVISNDEKKKILHRRWGFVAFLAVIFITAMELWPIVFGIFFMFLIIVLIFWFIDWITGADLDRRNVDEMNEKRKEEGLPPAPLSR